MPSVESPGSAAGSEGLNILFTNRGDQLGNRGHQDGLFGALSAPEHCICESLKLKFCAFHGNDRYAFATAFSAASVQLGELLIVLQKSPAAR